ncbi:FimD/PapC C-terminal domain-containing protein [Providencia sneebia]|uniref:FimD/PapC C-terminal domain-containing protein n=1 Tax=Providencia sneebia TaxID=516075 RepID=UPI001F42B0A5|nr:FimD/PapC C-terminal domain-containing protein [Providencia sneebia]
MIDDKTKQELGIISDNGNVYLTGISPKEKYTVSWGDSNKCHFTTRQLLEQNQQHILIPCL